MRPLLAILSVSFAWAQSPDRIVLQTSTILDGKGGIQKNQQIVIDGSRIREIRSGKGAVTYDLRGLTVMPG
jgi:imidazolonepropionase-like amidohydrolase